MSKALTESLSIQLVGTEDKLHTIASILSGHFNPRKSGEYANEL